MHHKAEKVTAEPHTRVFLGNAPSPSHRDPRHSTISADRCTAGSEHLISCHPTIFCQLPCCLSLRLEVKPSPLLSPCSPCLRYVRYHSSVSLACPSSPPKSAAGEEGSLAAGVDGDSLLGRGCEECAGSCTFHLRASVAGKPLSLTLICNTSTAGNSNVRASSQLTLHSSPRSISPCETPCIAFHLQYQHSWTQQCATLVAYVLFVPLGLLFQLIQPRIQ